METEVVVDSDFLIDLLRAKEGARRLAEEMLREGTRVYSTAANVFELWLGALKLRKRKETESLIDDLEILPLSREAAVASAGIVHSLSRRGETIDYRDAFIAGIAMAEGITAIVSNDEVFGRIEGLRTVAF